MSWDGPLPSLKSSLEVMFALERPCASLGWMLVLAAGRLMWKVLSRVCTSLFVLTSGAGSLHLGLAAAAGGQSSRAAVLPLNFLVDKCL